MKHKSNILSASAFFLIIAVLQILGLLFNDTLAFVTSPFITISLAIVYLTSVNKVNLGYTAALFFSFWGDLFLLFKADFLLFGLVFFLIAQALFIKVSFSFLIKKSFTKTVLSSIPFLIIFGGVVYVVNKSLGEMLFPIIVYGIVICSFGTITLLNYFQEKSTENLWLILGAVFFILSDSLFVIHKFYDINEVYRITMITTYILAQYLICKAMIAKSVKA
ncbi:lysoplasmalogenase [Polaribacter sp. L3A8]|uniref:lysoplasmalogenase n=1 Tax=Polaribacter sp. L3A8 TaxID=2686361 RepID=UPI00131C3E79|nr:lysoplasmalogenase [Polaribacter sp. L3A8]